MCPFPAKARSLGGWLSLILPVVLWGCGVARQFQEGVQESMTLYPSPGALACDDSTGLLLIDAVSTRPLQTLGLRGAAIYDVRSPDDDRLSGAFNTGGLLPSGSGLVAFQGLPEGTYRVSRLRLANPNYEETLQLPATSTYEVRIEPGKIHYFGKVRAHRRVGPNPPEVAVNRDVEAEQEAWTKVLGRFDDSGCAPLIRRRLEVLGE